MALKPFLIKPVCSGVLSSPAAPSHHIGPFCLILTSQKCNFCTETRARQSSSSQNCGFGKDAWEGDRESSPPSKPSAATSPQPHLLLRMNCANHLSALDCNNSTLLSGQLPIWPNKDKMWFHQIFCHLLQHTYQPYLLLFFLFDLPHLSWTSKGTWSKPHNL